MQSQIPLNFEVRYLIMIVDGTGRSEIAVSFNIGHAKDEKNDFGNYI